MARVASSSSRTDSCGRSKACAVDERHLRVAVKNIARALGDDVSEERPILDARLPDGSRVAAIFPPCSVGGTTLTIRKFHTRFFTADELVRIGTMSPAVLACVRTAIEQRQNILISGGTSTGKTTLLNALAAYLPATERLVVIEDTAELQIDLPNLVRLEARREHATLPAVTIRDLLRATLRHRPDRIVLGEVRGGEAFDLLQALNTGHAGTLSTIHANSARASTFSFRLVRRAERHRAALSGGAAADRQCGRLRAAPRTGERLPPRRRAVADQGLLSVNGYLRR